MSSFYGGRSGLGLEIYGVTSESVTTTSSLPEDLANKVPLGGYFVTDAGELWRYCEDQTLLDCGNIIVDKSKITKVLLADITDDTDGSKWDALFTGGIGYITTTLE